MTTTKRTLMVFPPQPSSLKKGGSSSSRFVMDVVVVSVVAVSFVMLLLLGKDLPTADAAVGAFVAVPPPIIHRATLSWTWTSAVASQQQPPQPRTTAATNHAGSGGRGGGGGSGAFAKHAAAAAAALSMAVVASAGDDRTSSPPSSSSSSSSKDISSTRKVAILLCPAQFCVPGDYDDLWEALPDRIEMIDAGGASSSSSSSSSPSFVTVDRALSRVVPLTRRDWIKVAKQLPTRNFFDATLEVHKTLDWYFEAMEEALSDILAAQNSDGSSSDSSTTSICLVGHSIGGWVARAYLGGLSRSSTAISRTIAEDPTIITSLITLGTPHMSPHTALVDQTRGLLAEVAATQACSSHALVVDRKMKVTCVCSSGLAGKFLSSNVEEVVAASSYLPLLGWNTMQDETLGDGIVPLDLAFMEAPAGRVVLEKCRQTGRKVRHSHVLPTPWNLWDPSAPSIRLDSFDDGSAASYLSREVVQEWAQHIQ